MKYTLFSIVLFCFLLNTVQAYAEEITVATVDAQPGETVTLDVSIDIPTRVSAAVFTLSYSDQLTLTGVTSSFFDTFNNQWAMLSPPPNPMPPNQVDVDGTTYEQPLLFNVFPGSEPKALVAAARVQPGAIDTVLFTLEFAVDSNAADGIYPVSISHTLMNNSAAGYVTDEYLPILIESIQSEDDPALAFQPIATDLVNGSIQVNIAPEDVDNDGIPDQWERQYFPDDPDPAYLDRLSANGDYDRDGYTDLQEYLNSTDPTIKNAPGLPGYHPPIAGSLPAIMMLLLNDDN